MTTLEKAAKVICEKLFGPFDPKELDSPSSVSAQSVMATRAALEALKDSEVDIPYTEPSWVKSAMDSWNDKLDAILNEKA